MIRWALCLEYDGMPFVGWQRQRGGLSVQEVLEQAALVLTRGRKVAAAVAGRTDAGVHAAAQVAAIELPEGLNPHHVAEALTYHMRPNPVAVLRAAPAPAGWHPRFSAIRRRYRYAILNRRARPVLLAGRVWHVPRPLDAAAMARAAEFLIGRHDFSSFRAAQCQATGAQRTLEALNVRREGELVLIEAEARSFLHHQVRNIAGTLRFVGEGRWPPERVGEILAAADRRLAGPTAPAAGLTLVGVDYPRDPFAL